MTADQDVTAPHPGRPTARTGAGNDVVDVHEVQLGDSRVTLRETRREPDRFRSAFERARTDVGHARCLCCPGRPRLVIRRRAGRYWLACWPSGGDYHDPGCRFFHDASPTTSVRDDYARSALDELSGGAARIRLTDALTIGPRRAHGEPSESGSTAAGRRRRMGASGSAISPSNSTNAPTIWMLPAPRTGS